MDNIYSAITGEAAFTVDGDNVLRSAITGRPAYILPEGWGKSVKGKVETIADLPSEGNHLGDQYYVTDEASFYVWNGNAWGPVSGDFVFADGLVVSGNTVTAPAFPGGTVSITPESGAASFAVEAGKVYQLASPVSSLTISSVVNSPRESVLFFAFSGGTTAPTVALPQTLGVVGELPAWEAGKTYVASVQFGNIVAQELTDLEDAEA